MARKALLFTAIIVAALGLTASRAVEKGKKVDMSKVPPAAKKSGLTYEADIKPMLEKSCVKCHSGNRPKSKYSMESLASLIKGGESGEPAIVPGHSDKSNLVLYASDAVEEMEMPPLEKRDRFPALTKQQVGLIRAWIDQGAK
jgi:hypothetical protein